MDGHLLAPPADAPLLLRVGIGLLGGVLLVAGARWYHRAIVLSGAAAGGIAGWWGIGVIGGFVPDARAPAVVLAAAGVGALALAIAARLAHKLALTGIGGVVGAAVGAAAAGALDVPVIAATLLGIVVGGLVFPWLYDQLLKVLTPLAGAVAVAWAVGRPDGLALVIGLWVFGAVVQLVGDRGAPESEPERDEEDA